MWASIVSGRLPVTEPCPNCLRRLEAVTAVGLEHRFDRLPNGRVSIKGHATRCGYCWALLIFADEHGHLRLMTKEERANYRVSEDIGHILDHMRNVFPPRDDFTKKSPN